MRDTIHTLYREGGIPRFYHGVWFALAEGPLSRGIGAAANYATLHMMAQTTWAHKLPMVMQTAISSLGVATFRLLYYPLDTAKTTMQVEGSHGLTLLRERVRRHGVRSLYNGAGFSILSASLRHTLWFSTYNILAGIVDNYSAEAAREAGDGVSHNLHVDSAGFIDLGPVAPPDPVHPYYWIVLQNAAIGLTCAMVTDVVGNPLSLLKAYRQTADGNVSYREAFTHVTREHGVRALFTRGLSTRLIVDALNSIVFTVLWRLWAPKHAGEV
jgi:hypothetical protein